MTVRRGRGWVLALLALCLGLGAQSIIARSQIDRLEQKITMLDARIRRLSYNTASGGGVNIKMMPDPVTGQPTVPLAEMFSFDRNHAMCRVDTNPRPFAMATFQRGKLIVPAGRFFMSMVATTIEQYAVTTLPTGSRTVRMRGGLSCATEVGQAHVTIGSRNASEHATYLIEAIDGGVGGGNAGDAFAFTAFFDPTEAPINYSLFGPKFTFTGQMVEGEITIVDPTAP